MVYFDIDNISFESRSGNCVANLAILLKDLVQFQEGNSRLSRPQLLPFSMKLSLHAIMHAWRAGFLLFPSFVSCDCLFKARSQCHNFMKSLRNFPCVASLFKKSRSREPKVFKNFAKLLETFETKIFCSICFQKFSSYVLPEFL